MNEIEEKKNQLNLEMRSLLSIIDMIDGNAEEYENYVENTMDESSFLDLQIRLVTTAKERMINIFKD